jgi:UDPglucose 6-dehydrogenase
MVEKIKNAVGNLEGKTLGILGITFKPKTDDMREAPSLTILTELAKFGAKLKIFDPEGKKEGTWRLSHIKENIEFCSNEYEACESTDGLVIITEWHQFRNMNLERLKDTMKDYYFFDLRNIYERELVEEKGFKYCGVGI